MADVRAKQNEEEGEEKKGEEGAAGFSFFNCEHQEQQLFLHHTTFPTTSTLHPNASSITATLVPNCDQMRLSFLFPSFPRTNN